MPRAKSSERQPVHLEGAFPFQLVDVWLREVSAQRCEAEPGRQVKLPIMVSLRKDVEERDRLLMLSFETRVPSTEGSDCNIKMTLEGRFRKAGGESAISPKEEMRFERVDAIVLLWPYLREHLHDLTLRMHLDVPPLPIIDSRLLLAKAGTQKEAGGGREKKASTRGRKTRSSRAE